MRQLCTHILEEFCKSEKILLSYRERFSDERTLLNTRFKILCNHFCKKKKGFNQKLKEQVIPIAFFVRRTPNFPSTFQLTRPFYAIVHVLSITSCNDPVRWKSLTDLFLDLDPQEITQSKL